MRESFPTGRTFARNLTGTARSVSADKILTDSAALPISGSIVALPQFAVCDYEGRESINRIQWESASCVHVIEDDQTLKLSWTIEDSSLPTQQGTITIAAELTGGHILTGQLPQLVAGTEPRVIAAVSASGLRRQLTTIRDTGKQEMFELVMLLLPYVRKAVDSAARRVYREIHNVPSAPDEKIIPVIDQVEADVVVDKMLYGDDGSDSSMMTRLVRRTAATDAVVRKSVLQFVSTAIWSSAETHVRAAIGDPHAGRIIRRLARAISSANPQVVLDAYRTTYPEAQMGLTRVEAALTADATIGARQVAFDSVRGTQDEEEVPQW